MDGAWEVADLSQLLWDVTREPADEQPPPGGRGGAKTVSAVQRVLEGGVNQGGFEHSDEFSWCSKCNSN